MYKFLIHSCGLVANMAWRRRRCRALRFGGSYLQDVLVAATITYMVLGLVVHTYRMC
jgi:hypothetical protein